MTYPKFHQSAIVLIAGAILTIITLLAGVSVFVIMQRHTEALMSKSLQLTLEANAQLTRTEIGATFDRTVVISTRRFMTEQLQLVDARADDTAARTRLDIVIQSFFRNGLTAIALYGEDGQELIRVGVFAQQPELVVPLNNFSGHVQLIWDGQLLLRAVVEIKKEGRVVGKVMTESSLPATMGAVKHANRLSKTEELVLCAPFGLKMQCFPTAINPKTFTVPQRSPDGVRLPMTRALEGETGFTFAKDYRDQKVAAAYMPVGDLGLGMVLKMDSTELYGPVWDQLRYLIPLLAGVLLIALLLLRWRLTPLVLQLTDEIAERKKDAAVLQARTEEADAARQRLNDAIDALGEGFVLFDADDRLVMCNQRYKDFYAAGASLLVPGTSFEAIIRDSLARGQPPEAMGREEAWLVDRMAGHRSSGYAHEQTLLGGRVVRVTEHRTLLGETIAVHSNITDLKQAELRLLNVIEGAQVGTWDWVASTGELRINERWAGMLGYAREELTPMGYERWATMLHPEDAPGTEELVQRCLTAGMETYEAEYRLRHKAGHWLWVMNRGRVFRRSTDGTAELMAGVQIDISERQELHAQLEESHRQMNEDMEAAAVLQLQGMPKDSVLGALRLSTYFRPSRILSGDTFDFVPGADGRITVFQVDVAGHGAAAGFVSVAAHAAVKQLIQQSRPTDSLAGLVAAINREWRPHLTYFTMVIARIDPKAQTCTFVQAGHPPPMILNPDHGVRVPGNGGLPVGVLLDATYDEETVTFGPKDRLILISDGVYEAANPAGEQYSEERFLAFLNVRKDKPTRVLLDEFDKDLREWRGSETLEDDATIVVIEGAAPDAVV